MIFILDEHGQRKYVSNEWAALTGQAVEDSLGEGWLERVHVDDQAIVLGILKAATAEQAEFSIRYRLLKPDDSARWVGVGGVPSFGPPGKSFIGFLGSSTELADTDVDLLSAYGNVGRFVPPAAHPSTVPVDELDRIADCLLLAHSLIEADGVRQALPAVRTALVEVGFALADRAKKTRLVS